MTERTKRSKVCRILLCVSLLAVMAVFMSLSALGANIESDINSARYGDPVASGSCYDKSGGTYNAKWALYNSATSGKYTMYFYLDSSLGSNTELVLGFDPSLNDGKGGVAGGWGADLTNAKYEWSSYHGNIDTLVLGDGITKLASPFYKAEGLKTIELPSSLTELCSMALFNCYNVERAYIRGNTPTDYHFDASKLKTIGSFGLTNMHKLKTVSIDSLETLGGTNVFDGWTVLTSITIPAALPSLPSKTFTNCPNLESVTFLGDTEIKYLSTAVTKADAVENKDGVSFALGESSKLAKIYAFPGTKARAFAEKFGFDVSLPAAGTYSVTSSDGTAKLEIDLESGAMKLSPTGTEKTLNIADKTIQSGIRLCADKIKSAEVSGFTKLLFAMSDEQVSEDDAAPVEKYFNLFAYLPALESVHFTEAHVRLAVKDFGKGLFEGSSALRTVWFGAKKTENTADISGFTLGTTDYPSNFAVNLFAGCTALTSVTLPSDELFTEIKSSTFAGCAALREIVLPANITSIAARAFRGCYKLDNAYILAETCSYVSSGTDASFENNTTVSSRYVPKLVAALNFDGFSIRYTKYNGLRGVFCFDNDGVAAVNTANGYTLREYGVLAVSSANKASYGSSLTLNTSSGEYEATTTGLVKKPVYKSGSGYVDNILSVGGSECETSGATHFALAIVKYEDHFREDVYMAGYEVWEYDGESYIVYTDLESSGGKASMNETNIYEVSLGMYKDGFVNAKQDTENVIWNTLKSGGAVTLGKTSGYTVPEGVTTLDGKEFGDTFEFSEIPFVSVSGSTVTPLDTNFTLLEDCDTDGGYVIVFRGTGATAGCFIWGSTRMQYSTQWLGTSAYEGVTSSPNPVLTSSAAEKIAYAIVDHGITELGNYVFTNYYTGTKIETVVYPETLTKLGAGFTNGYAKTVFRAGTDKKYVEEGLYDLHYSHLNIAGMSLNGCSNVVKLHLPTNFTSIGGGGVFNSLTKLERVWCSDTFDGGKTGIIDLSGATGLTKIGSEAFINTKGAPATVLRLPNGCTDLASNIIIQAGKENKCSITKIEQVTENETVSAFCTANGLDYVTGSFN